MTDLPMTDLPMLDSEDVAGMSLPELYAAHNRITMRIDRLREQKRTIDRELVKRGPTRFGETIMLPPSWKWTPYDKTFGAVRHWCGNADDFLAIAHIAYIRSTSLASLAAERAKAGGEDPKATAQLVLDSLGSRVPAGEYPSFVPIEKAPKKYQRLADALGEA